MRALLRVALVVALVCVAGIVALALVMPSVVESEAVRERVQTAAVAALGREVRYAALDFGLFPPSLLVVEASVAGATAQSQPLLEAERVALRVALLPLLTRTVVLDSFVVDGATLRLVRTESGIELPRPPSARGVPREPDAGAAAPQPAAGKGEGDAAVDLALTRPGSAARRFFFPGLAGVAGC